MAKQTEKCFFCGAEVDLNGHHVVIPGPDGKEVVSCPHHDGLMEHGGKEVNAPEPEPETEVKDEENGKEEG